VAIGIGLFGIAASFSAQVLARRKEFGLLAHLGLTRRNVLSVVAAEGLAWTMLGTIAGTLLGLGVAVILVHVVNPQSFHWTMELRLPCCACWRWALPWCWQASSPRGWPGAGPPVPTRCWPSRRTGSYTCTPVSVFHMIAPLRSAQ
jgi:hypothetical protein